MRDGQAVVPGMAPVSVWRDLLVLCKWRVVAVMLVLAAVYLWLLAIAARRPLLGPGNHRVQGLQGRLARQRELPLDCLVQHPELH